MRPVINAVYVLLVAAVASFAPSAWGREAAVVYDGITFHKTVPERLPDMGTPRSAHAIKVIGGDIAVFGGHTTGFIPSASAEIYRGGEWKEIPMLYAHDGGFAVTAPDGRILLGGGSGEPFGIGQSWGVEAFDPVSVSFAPVSIMSRKRAYASAAVLSSGRIVVSGNWYADDDISILGDDYFSKPVSEGRCVPVIFPTGNDDAVIFGSVGVRGERTEGFRVDRFMGEPYDEPLLKEWVPLTFSQPFSSEDCRIADNTYLIVAESRVDSTYAIVKVSHGSFSLLETEGTIPTCGIRGGRISVSSQFRADRRSRCAYVTGMDADGVLYILKISYDAIFDGGKATLEAYYAEAPEGGFPSEHFVAAIPSGGLVLAGGPGMDPENPSKESNFFVRSEVWLFSPGEAPVVAGRRREYLPWILLLLVTAAGICAALVRRRREETVPPAKQPPEEENTDLVSRMKKLMEEDKIYLQGSLTKADVARMLGTNVTYVSAAVNSQMGISFTEFISGYRIRHAKQLMKDYPGKKISEIVEESGFSSEKSFYRCFKAVTGMTPGEWKSSRLSSNEGK